MKHRKEQGEVRSMKPMVVDQVNRITTEITMNTTTSEAQLRQQST